MWMSAPFAWAQGTVTSITPDPVPAIACQLDTIEINGTGTCGTAGQANGFTLELGDTTATVHLPGNFPIKVYHTYKSAGTYTLRAQGAANCSGNVVQHLQVLGPVITSIFPFSQITPGGGVILIGQNFGDLPGQIVIKFTNQLIGTPLENIQWGNTFASGTIPKGITGQPDEQVTLTVFAQCGAASNELSEHFTAARDMAEIPFNRITCSTSVGAGNSDQCQDWGQDNWPLECGCCPSFGLQKGPTGFYGYHASGWGFSGETGNDDFWSSPALQNGWVLSSVSGLSGTRIGGGSFANVASSSPPGSNTPNAAVSWKADNCGVIFYWGNMNITGPAGMPY
jgi:hypothetical protein